MLRSTLSAILLLCFVLTLTPTGSAAQLDPIAELLAGMTVEERIGQLFIVPFVGPDAGDNTNIAELIIEYNTRLAVWCSWPPTGTSPTTIPHHVR